MVERSVASPNGVIQAGASRNAKRVLKRLALVLLSLSLTVCSQNRESAPNVSELDEIGGLEDRLALPGLPSGDPHGMSPGLRAAFIATVQARADSSYHFVDTGAASHAENPTQGFAVKVSDEGLLLEPPTPHSADGYALALSLESVGRESGARHDLTPNLTGSRFDAASANRARLVHTLPGGEIEEWFANGELGVEQGFVIASPPQGDPDKGNLMLRIGVFGLKPTEATSSDGRPYIALVNESGERVLGYSDLFVTDASNQPLTARLRAIDEAIVLDVDDAKATYPLRIDPLIWSEQELLRASDGITNAYFGFSVALSGDVALVGAYGNPSGGLLRGQAYVFSRDQGGADNWGQVKILQASDESNGIAFGYSVALSGNVAVVGAYGHPSGGTVRGQAYVFSKDQGGTDNWGQVKILQASDEANGAQFGAAVGVSGDLAVVGAYLHPGGGSYRGQAYVFSKDQGGINNWGEVKVLRASDEGDNSYFGTSVAVSGNVALVGADAHPSGGSLRGQAYVFSKDQGGVDNWGEVEILEASDEANNAHFGFSVALSGDLALVGAYNHSSGGSLRGQAYVFSRERGGPDNWGEVRILEASDEVDDAYFGIAVGLSAERALVGAFRHPSGGNLRGQAYTFSKDLGGADNWGQEKVLQASDEMDDAWFGRSVALSTDTLLVGANLHAGGGIRRGQAYLFASSPAAPNGDPCTLNAECDSGWCVDLVCCDLECGGNNPSDCQACSVLAGAAQDGVCHAALTDRDCSDGIFCNGSETCNAGVCSDSSGDPCIGADGDFDCAESCDEVNQDCLADDPEGSSCDDGQACNGADSCSSGVCDQHAEACGTGGTGGGGAGGGGAGGEAGAGAGGSAGSGASAGAAGTNGGAAGSGGTASAGAGGGAGAGAGGAAGAGAGGAAGAGGSDGAGGAGAGGAAGGAGGAAGAGGSGEAGAGAGGTAGGGASAGAAGTNGGVAGSSGAASAGRGGEAGRGVGGRGSSGAGLGTDAGGAAGAGASPDPGGGAASDSGDDGGCSCRTVGRSQGSPLEAMLLVMMSSLALVRRRRIVSVARRSV